MIGITQIMATIGPSRSEKKIIEMFHEQISSKTLSTFTCAVCGETSLSSTQCIFPIADIKFLEMEKWRKLESGSISDEKISPPPLPFNAGPLKNIMLDPDGVIIDLMGDIQLLLCKDCFFPVKHKKIPALSLANLMYLGPVPSELKDLTVIEEAMIACC